MYTYQSEYIDIDEYVKEKEGLPVQVSQISLAWEKKSCICLLYDRITKRVIINDQYDNWYYFTCKNIPNLRIIDVIYGLGFTRDIAVVDWNESNISPTKVLTSLVTEAPLNQITLHKPIVKNNTMLLEVSLIVILMCITILCFMWC